MNLLSEFGVNISTCIACYQPIEQVPENDFTLPIPLISWIQARWLMRKGNYKCIFDFRLRRGDDLIDNR